MFDYAWVVAYATRHNLKIATLSAESVALLFTGLDNARERFNWENAGAKVTDAEWDIIEALVAQADLELMSNPLLGTIFPYATTLPPDGALPCDGTHYLKADYPLLAAALNTAFNVDSTHFRVPDLRGRTIIGVGTGSGLSAYAVDANGGQESHALSTGELASHSHGVTDPGHNHTHNETAHTHTVTDPGHNHTHTDGGHNHAITDPGHLHSFTRPTFLASRVSPGSQGSYEGATTGSTGSNVTSITINNNTTGVTNNSNTTGVTNNSNTTGISTNSAGSGTAHENRQPYSALEYAIWAR